MARRREGRRSAEYTNQPRGKSAAEARVERLTWFFLVLIIAVISLIPEGAIPNAYIPFAGAVVLLGSGLYQYSRRWRVSPVTWIAGSIMLVMGGYNAYSRPDADLTGAVLITFALVILFGTLTGET